MRAHPCNRGCSLKQPSIHVKRCLARLAARQSLRESSTKRSRDSGLLKESRLAASSGGVPERIFLIGTSSFLPLSVFGTSGTAKISFGTWRGEVRSRMLVFILFFMSLSSCVPSVRTTKGGVQG